MVAGEDDDRVVGQPEFFQFTKESADLRVGEADAGEVTVDEPARGCFVERARRRDIRVGSQFTGGMHRLRRRVLRTTFNLRQCNLGPVVQVPIFLRRDERQVRLVKTHGEEKRFVLLCQFAQVGDRLGRRLVVVVLLVGTIGRFRRGTALATLLLASRQIELDILR